MRITVSVPGKFQPAYLWARWLESRDRLTRLLTPLPYGRVAAFGVSRGRARALAPVGVWNYAVQRFGPRWIQPANQIAVTALFDLLASRALGPCDVFNGWASAALISLRKVHQRGLPAVLQTGSAHIVTQTALLTEELERLGLTGVVTHPAVIRRTLAEYEEADLIVTPSRFVRQTFIERGVPESKLAVVCETAMPRVEPPAERPARETPRILFVGRVDVRKGVPYLLDAFRRLDANATLRLVGPVGRALLERLRPLPDGVELVGPRAGAALAAEFREADFFVLPSVEDGFGLAAVEAMAAGLPVIVSDHAGCADLIDDGVNGFVTPARDAAALAERMRTLARDARLRDAMGRAAFATASRRTWEAYGLEMDGAYAALATPRGTGVPAHARAM